MFESPKPLAFEALSPVASILQPQAKVSASRLRAFREVVEAAARVNVRSVA